jgi:hypothetical protein
MHKEPNDERRRRLRIYHKTAFVFARAGGETVGGTTADISWGGFRFVSDQRLQIGETISTRLRFPNNVVHEVEGVIKGADSGNPARYNVAFTPRTIARLAAAWRGE